MKYAIVPFSKISTHPFQSLLPADYLGDPGYIKELLADLTPSNQKRIQWMVTEKIVTEEQLKAYVEEMAHAVLKKPMELAEKIEFVHSIWYKTIDFAIKRRYT